MESQIVIGFGEIGQSLFNILHERYGDNVQHKDLEELTGQFDILHICYGYSDKFVEITKQYISEYKPRLVIIHSTVPVGITRLCGDVCVNSPCRGRHPHLEEGLRTFIKYIGGIDMEKVKLAMTILEDAGIPTKIVDKPETSELAKLGCTTYYGLQILFQKEFKKLCDQVGADYDIAYRDLNESYALGYIKLNEPQFVRPILKDMPGQIGGHCVIKNCEILNDSFNWPIAKFILSLNEIYKGD